MKARFDAGALSLADAADLDAERFRASGADAADAAASGTDPEACWAQACRRLRAELGDAVFGAWFARLELDCVSDDTAYLSVPTNFLKTWIQSHYVDRLAAALAAEAPEIKRIVLGLRSSGRAAAPRSPRQADERGTGSDVRASSGATTILASVPRAEAGQMPHAKPSPEGLSGSPLDRRLTFASFVVGGSNQLAFVAAQRVAEAMTGDVLLYSPLYIHAAVGLGKTHLLQATAHAVTASGRRVIYLTAERFMYGFVASLKAQNSIAFKEKLRGIDVLVIDDAQFLQGKSIQTEFCHTLNALIDDGRQVIVAADRPPADLESLEERVRSRLAGGLCVEIDTLDEALRLKILDTRVTAAQALHPGFVLSSAVLAYVARTICTNGRDLDGAVNRLLAHATLSGRAHTVETAEAAIRDLVRTREPKRVKIEDIQKLVATHYNVSRADILSSRRTATVVRPRQIAMYLSKALTLRSLPEIGRRFGGRDHTTVLHAVRKIEGLCGKEAALAEEVELLKRLLQD